MPSRRSRLLSMIALALLALPAASLAQHTERERASTAVAAPADAPPSLVERLRAAADRLPSFSARSSAAALRSTLPQDPPLVGVPVALDELATAGVARKFERLSTPEGTALAARIRVDGAAALRIGILVEHLPKGSAVVVLPAAADGAAQWIPASTIRRNIRRNRAAGDTSDDARTAWSGIVRSGDVIVAVQLAAGTAPDRARLRIPLASALDTEPQSLDCENDVTCHAEWLDQAAGTAQMYFTSGGLTYACTGTLLADSDPSTAIPYFLTARHCISTQTVASTLQTVWFYQVAVCHGAQLDPRMVERYGGAKLLYGSTKTDTSFLRLNDAPPADAVFQGWSLDVGTGLAITGVHHPAADRTKISFGSSDSLQTCNLASDESYTCTPASLDTATFLRVSWSSGGTEGGSSGSGLFDSSGHLIGQLLGGIGNCLGLSDYGRFDVAYKAALKQWLGQGADAKPDFSVSSIETAPSDPAADASFTATVVLKNVGGAAGDAGSLSLWLDRSSAATCGTLADRSIAVGQMAAGESRSVTFDGLAAGAAGSKTLLAFADGGCSTSEESESDNQKSLAYTVGSTSGRSCGDANADGSVSAGDALAILRAAVGSSSCSLPCACDVAGGGSISASDALTTLKIAVGQPVSGQCQCVPPSPCVNWGYDAGVCRKESFGLRYTCKCPGFAGCHIRRWSDNACKTCNTAGCDLFVANNVEYGPVGLDARYATCECATP